MLKSFKKFMSDESAQGMTEYILLVVALIAVLILFKDKIYEIVDGKMESLKGDIGGFTI